jgi:precorrin-4 methylase
MRREQVTRTVMVIVGRALARPLPRTSKLYDGKFSHGYREGKGS